MSYDMPPPLQPGESYVAPAGEAGEPSLLRIVTIPDPQVVVVLEELKGLEPQILFDGAIGLNRPPWDRFAMLTLRSLKDRYVNVVVGPEGVATHPPVKFGTSDASLTFPGTLFASSYTPSVPNIAIVTGPVQDDPALEDVSLQHYNRVFRAHQKTAGMLIRLRLLVMEEIIKCLK
jgi:hypothetical protein